MARIFLCIAMIMGLNSVGANEQDADLREECSQMALLGRRMDQARALYNAARIHAAFTQDQFNNADPETQEQLLQQQKALTDAKIRSIRTAADYAKRKQELLENRKERERLFGTGSESRRKREEQEDLEDETDNGDTYGILKDTPYGQQEEERRAKEKTSSARRLPDNDEASFNDPYFTIRRTKPASTIHTAEYAGQPVKPMVKKDLPAVLRIEEQVWERPWTEEVFSKIANRRAVASYIIEDAQGNILGYMLTEYIAPTIRILNLTVNPQYRREPVEDALFATLRGKVPSDRYKYLISEASKGDAFQAERLKRLGFIQKGTTWSWKSSQE